GLIAGIDNWERAWRRAETCRPIKKVSHQIVSKDKTYVETTSVPKGAPWDTEEDLLADHQMIVLFRGSHVCHCSFILKTTSAVFTTIRYGSEQQSFHGFGSTSTRTTSPNFSWTCTRIGPGDLHKRRTDSSKSDRR